MKKVPAPWAPAEYEAADITAIQACIVGEAAPEQQIRAMKWVIEKASAYMDMPFRPGGEDGRRDTDFACGRMFVGQQVVKLSRLNASALRRSES